MGSVQLLLIGVLALAVLALATVLASFRRQEQRARSAERLALDAAHRSRALASSDLALLRTDLTLLGAQVGEYAEGDPEFAGPLQERIETLVAAVDELGDALTAAEEPEDIQAATAAMADVRQQLAVLSARLADEPPPAPRPPCFFNPNHGPSATVVLWTGEDNQTVRVPCCASDAERLRSGAAPYSRTVPRGGVRVPWWEAGSSVRPWALGWFERWLAATPSGRDLVEPFPSFRSEGSETAPLPKAG